MEIKYKLHAGFTLIELLIVIGVVSILMVGLVAAINPAEQLNKSRDNKKKVLARSLLTSVNNYVATRGYWPWDAAPYGGGCSDPNNGDNTTGYTLASNWTTCTSVLVSQGELKSGFSSSSELSSLYVSYDVAQKTPVICFQPQSQSEKNNKTETKYFYTGVDAWCDENVSTSCYWCIR